MKDRITLDFAEARLCVVALRWSAHDEDRQASLKPVGSVSREAHLSRRNYAFRVAGEINARIPEGERI